MNTKLIIFILTCFEAANLQANHLMTSERKTNFFHKINSNIHNITNKLWISLKIDKNSTKSHYFQMLLTMHYYLNKIAERNCRVYEELKNIILKDFNVGKSDKTNLEEEIFLSTVIEENDNFKNNITDILNNSFELESDYTKRDSADETIEDLNVLWSDINKLTIDDIFDPNLNETDGLSNTKYSPISNEEIDIADNNTRRLYKGKKTKIKSYPFLVSIHIMGEFLCAGSIISKDMILTAASCLQIAYNNKLYRENPRTIFVRLGSDHTKHSGELIPIVHVTFHPKYDSITLRHNLAIIKMLEKLKHATKKMIRMIKYDKSADTLAKNVEDIAILGWGDRDAKLGPNNLRKLAITHLDIYNYNDCQEVYSKYYVTDTNFCAGFTSKGGGACMGDVGGPAIVDEELVGLVSFGPTVCGMRDAPTVFTKVGYYARWIDSVINQKPVIRQTEIVSTTYSSPRSTVVFVPMTFKPTLEEHVTERKTRTKSNEYPEEILILKRLIQNFILANNSVIDYLINPDDIGDEEPATKKDTHLFLDLDNFKSSQMQFQRHRTTKSLDIEHFKRPQVQFLRDRTTTSLNLENVKPLQTQFQRDRTTKSLNLENVKPLQTQFQRDRTTKSLNLENVKLPQVQFQRDRTTKTINLENVKPPQIQFQRDRTTKSVSKSIFYGASNITYIDGVRSVFNIMQPLKEFFQRPQVKKTTLSLFESFEFPEIDDVSIVDESESKHLDESSSYYEQEIPIDIIRAPLRETTTPNTWSRITRFITVKQKVGLNKSSSTIEIARPIHKRFSTKINEYKEQHSARNDSIKFIDVTSKIPPTTRSRVNDSKEVTNHDEIKNLDPWPLGVAMTISDENIDYGDKAINYRNHNDEVFYKFDRDNK